MSFRPLHDRVLVRRVDEDEKTSGGIKFQIQPKKNQVKVKLYQLAQAREMITEIELLSMLKKVIKFYLANGLVQK